MKRISLPKKYLREYGSFVGIIYMKYVRDEKRNPIGVVIMNSDYNIGWSLCNKKDKWDQSYGIRKAIWRFGQRKGLPEYNKEINVDGQIDGGVIGRRIKPVVEVIKDLIARVVVERTREEAISK